MRRYRKATGRESMRMRRAKSRLSLQQMQNAGTAMGMMAMSGQRDDQGFVDRLRDTFEDLTDMALSGDTGSKEFDDVM